MKTNTTKLRRALTAFVLTGAVMPIADLCAQVTVLDTNGTQIAAGTSLNAVQDSLNGNTAIISSDIVEPGNLKIVYTSGSPDANLNPVFTVKSDTPGTWRTIDLNNENRLIFHNVKENVPGMVNFHGEDIIIKNGFGEFGQKGGFIAAERGVKLTGNMQFLNISAAANSVICTYGGGVEVDGNFVFDGNKATDDSGAIFRIAYRSGYEVPDLVIRGSNVFTNNYAVDGDVIATFTGNSCNAIIEGTNVFNYNSADRGTAVIDSPNNFTISGNNQFNNNTVYGVKNTGPGVAYHDGSVIAGWTITISGTTEFKNNTIAGKYGAGAIYTSSSVYFTGDGSTAVFEGNTFENVEKGLAPAPNDIYGGLVSFADAGTYTFDGGINAFTLKVDEATVTMKSGSITTVRGKMVLSNGANVTFENGSQLTVNDDATLTVDNATLNLEGNVDFAGKLTMTNTTANFTADPGDHGFSTLKADSFTGTVNVDLNGFTVGAMDGDTVTLIDGAKAENVNITNGNLMTNANVDGKTAVTINQDKDGTTYGSAPVQGSELVGIDFGGKDSLEVHNFSLIVDGKDIDLNAFAEWLGENTGLDTAAGTGYVSVRLETPFEIMASDSFIWDFSGFQNGIANLQFASVNMMDSTVPEPTTWALLVLGGLGIFGIARKNRKAKK